MTSINLLERKVLEALAEVFDHYCGPICLSFDGVSARSGLTDRKAIRRACRSLKRKSLAEFHQGLWTEDGEMAGSGYCATKDGMTALSSTMREDK